MEKLQLGPKPFRAQNNPSRKLQLTFTCTKEECFIYLGSLILMRFDVMQHSQIAASCSEQHKTQQQRRSERRSERNLHKGSCSLTENVQASMAADN